MNGAVRPACSSVFGVAAVSEDNPPRFTFWRCCQALASNASSDEVILGLARVAADTTLATARAVVVVGRVEVNRPPAAEHRRHRHRASDSNSLRRPAGKPHHGGVQDDEAGDDEDDGRALAATSRYSNYIADLAHRSVKADIVVTRLETRRCEPIDAQAVPVTTPETAGGSLSAEAAVGVDSVVLAALDRCLSRRLGALQSAMEARFDRLEARVDSLERRLGR